MDNEQNTIMVHHYFVNGDNTFVVKSIPINIKRHN